MIVFTDNGDDTATLTIELTRDLNKMQTALNKSAKYRYIYEKKYQILGKTYADLNAQERLDIIEQEFKHHTIDGAKAYNFNSEIDAAKEVAGSSNAELDL